MRIGIVAGESSGDLLGAALIRSIKKFQPDARFEGVGGEQMIAEGFVSHHPMETLSVMGLVEPLKRLPRLLALKKDLLQGYLDNPPDVFIGIDSPEFNQRLELPLKKAGIPTVHYVSPSVWAWRQGRVKGIRKAVDLMLCLLPFEAEFYHREQVPAVFVGHPMADEIPLQPLIDPAPELDNLGDEFVALLPGSRSGEIEKIAPVFFAVADQLLKDSPGLKFLVPAAHEAARERLQAIAGERPHLIIQKGKTRQMLARSKAALVASGTATLEALLMKCPMVVAYRTDAFSWFVGSRMVKSDYISLANLIAGEGLVKERLQDDCRIEVLLNDMRDLLQPQQRKQMIQRFDSLHRRLRHGASDEAARAVLNLVGKAC